MKLNAVINETSDLSHFENNVRMFYVNMNSCGVYVQKKSVWDQRDRQLQILLIANQIVVSVFYTLPKILFFNYHNPSPNTEV